MNGPVSFSHTNMINENIIMSRVIPFFYWLQLKKKNGDKPLRTGRKSSFPEKNFSLATLASLSALDEDFPDMDRDLLPLDNIEL